MGDWDAWREGEVGVGLNWRLQRKMMELEMILGRVVEGVGQPALKNRKSAVRQNQ